MKDCDLDFLNLFRSVLRFWPKTVNVDKIHVNPGRPELYVVAGLGELGDAIAQRFIDANELVLMPILCDAITATLRSAALYSVEVNPQLLRCETVRDIFEARLRRGMANSELGWTEDDMALVERYFFANQR